MMRPTVANFGRRRCSLASSSMRKIAGGRLTPGRARRYKPMPTNCGNNSVVECNLAKVDVEGSNPFSRSNVASLLESGKAAPKRSGLVPASTNPRDSRPSATNPSRSSITGPVTRRPCVDHGRAARRATAVDRGPSRIYARRRRRHCKARRTRWRSPVRRRRWR